VSLAAKLDALARSLPEGVWLTGFLYEDRNDTFEKPQRRFLMKGACFLGADGPELGAIQALEGRIKQNAAFFKGFTSSRLEEIAAQQDVQQRYTYRTFQLTCSSDRVL
jgi:hypothetical protein